MTDDLPTPPLPDEIASTRVRESVNGFTRGRRPAGPACDGVDDLERIRRGHALEQRGEGEDLVVVHVADVDVDPLDPGDRTRPPRSPGG